MSRTDQPEAAERSGIGRGTGAVLPLLAVAGFFSVLMLAAAAQGRPVFRPVGEAAPTPSLTPPPEPEPTSSGLPEFEPREDSILLTVVTAVVVTLIAVVVLVVLFLGIRLLVRTLASLWQGRRLRRRTGAEVAPGVSTAEPAQPDIPDAVEIRRGVAQALAVLGRDGPPTDAIIAAWIGLEESAADAGVVRAPSETAAEFTVRILARRASLSPEVSRLLRLFEDVRFGGRIADEQDRETAARCLRTIEEAWR